MSNKTGSAAKCLYPGCPVPSNVLVKDFARWYCSSRSGRIHKRPNLTTVKNMLKKFFGGFVRVTGTDISDEYRRDVYTIGELFKSEIRSHNTHENSGREILW